MANRLSFAEVDESESFAEELMLEIEENGLILNTANGWSWASNAQDVIQTFFENWQGNE